MRDPSYCSSGGKFFSAVVENRKSLPTYAAPFAKRGCLPAGRQGAFHLLDYGADAPSLEEYEGAYLRMFALEGL